MEYTKVENGYALRVDKGEEIIEKITELCEKENIKAGSIVGLGAADHAIIGLYNVGEKQFHKKELNMPMEISSLIGNISRKDGEVYLHCHITVCDQNTIARGGHLVECTVAATAEIFITEYDTEIGRKEDDITGLNLFEF